MSEPSKPASDQGTGEPASGVARSWAASGEQTLLGVAPPIALPPLPKPAEPAPPATPPRPASSGAIAATRVIAVSDAAPVTPPAASPAPTTSPVATASPAQTPEDAPRMVSVPPQALPQRPASIGGWQSAGPAMTYQAPSLIETLTSMRSPLADAPPNISDSAQTEPDATPIFAEPAAPSVPPPVAQQASAPEPQQPAGAIAGAATGGWQPVMHTVPIPIARNAPPAPAEPPPAPAASPETFASTALSDDYLRAARDVVRAERDAARAEAARPPQPAFAPAAPAGDALANAATLQFETVPPVRAPLSEQPPVTSLPISVNLSGSWRKLEGPHPATMPFAEPRTTFPSWRVLLLVAISVLALIAIAAAAFVAVRRFAEASSATSELRVRPSPRVVRAPSAASAPPTASSESPIGERSDSDRSEGEEAELGARAARLVLLGRHGDARPLYAELARKHPGAPAYAVLERILARARGSER
jgi:hypothetical protein